MPTDKNQPQSKGTPIFLSKSALVRLVNESDPNTSSLWLIDVPKKILRPFMDESQFDVMFDNPEEARKAVVTLSSNELADGGILDDYQVLDNEFGIGPDGEIKEVQFSNHELQQRYGQPVNPEMENKAVTALDHLFSTIDPSSATQAPTTQAPVEMTPEQMTAISGGMSEPEPGMNYQ